jgi:hypothetical protein
MKFNLFAAKTRWPTFSRIREAIFLATRNFQQGNKFMGEKQNRKQETVSSIKIEKICNKVNEVTNHRSINPP